MLFHPKAAFGFILSFIALVLIPPVSGAEPETSNQENALLGSFSPGDILSCYHNTPIYEYDRQSGAVVHTLTQDVDSPFLGKFDDRGFLYVTDRGDLEVLVFSPQRQLVDTWYTGNGTQGIDIGWNTGRIYVATHGSAKVFENDGTFVKQIPYSTSWGTTDLAVDEDRNRLYLSTLHWDRIVYVCDLEGNEIARWGGP